ncbi:MAG: enolase C-terminal domain-like protein [Candidatus Latescibacteria bacterium]|nr:enolase C-terminal domain-like protein [Candidatus Latescibacterota bacterium]
MSIPIRVHRLQFGVRQVPMRLPFRFGAVTLTAAAQIHLFADIETSTGRRAQGVAADMLAPKWFDKDPNKSYADNMNDLIDSAKAASAAVEAVDEARPVFDLWRIGYDAAQAWGEGRGLNELTSAYGSTLVERAIIDGLGRAEGLTYYQLLRDNHLDIDLGVLHAELKGVSPGDLLAAAPRKRMQMRHTVGLLDPLCIEEVEPNQLIDDGLPQGLDQYIAQQDLRFFKIKVGGDVDADVERLAQIAEVIALVDDAKVTLDGNEQYSDPDLLMQLLDRLETGPDAVRQLYQKIIYLEQPLDRAVCLDASLAPKIHRLSERIPMVIDEADEALDTFRLSVDRGYRGVSSKVCKGMIKALANLGLCKHFSAAKPHDYFVTGEDLTNVPLVALQQDLTHLAAIDIAHVERNGHHYVRGIDHLPEAERVACRGAHRSLYDDVGEDLTSLRVVDGAMDLSSLQVPGLGISADVELASMIPLDRWQPQDLEQIGTVA